MVHFFHEYEKGKYKPHIQKYHDRILEGTPPAQAFDEVFGKDAETMQKEWKDYVKKLKP
jgi:hypothetical protein